MLAIFLSISSFSFAQEAAFDGEQELTLAEEQASENYIHQGMAVTKFNEMCEEGAEGFKDICTEDKYAFSGGMGRTLEAMLPAVTKAYSLIVGATNPKLTKKLKNDDGTPQLDDNGNQKTESKTDYCQYIAIAGEAISVGMAQMQNQQTQQNYESSKSEARQAATFYALAKNHKDQAKASKIQMGVWGSTAACYGVLLATGSVSGGVQLYAKAGGSALIALFYKKKADAHKKRAKLLEEMAKKLPQAGDCNPYTQPTCFCNEDTSFAADQANYMKFCVPKPLIARNQTNDAVACIDASRTLDPECNCVAQNNCIDRVLKTGALNFGIAPTLMKDPLAGLKPLSDGFGTGDLDNVTNRNLARVNEALKDYRPTDIGNLTDAEKDIARTISQAGIPSGAAAAIAKRGGSANLPASFSGGFGGGDLVASVPNKGLSKSLNSSKAQYKKGKSAGKSRSSRNNSSFRSSRSKNNAAKGGVKIDDSYALKAQREAEIIDNSDVSIFQVINNRYQSSAWRQFPEALVQEN